MREAAGSRRYVPVMKSFVLPSLLEHNGIRVIVEHKVLFEFFDLNHLAYSPDHSI